MEKLRRMAGKRSRMGTPLRRQKYSQHCHHEQVFRPSISTELPRLRAERQNEQALKATEPTRPTPTMVPSARLGAAGAG